MQDQLCQSFRVPISKIWCFELVDVVLCYRFTLLTTPPDDQEIMLKLWFYIKYSWAHSLSTYIKYKLIGYNRPQDHVHLRLSIFL